DAAKPLTALGAALACALDLFVQAEDGIRDDLVTGVQTCALPICGVRVILDEEDGYPRRGGRSGFRGGGPRFFHGHGRQLDSETRSEERRVGKEGDTRWSQ